MFTWWFNVITFFSRRDGTYAKLSDSFILEKNTELEYKNKQLKEVEKEKDKIIEIKDKVIDATINSKPTNFKGSLERLRTDKL